MTSRIFTKFLRQKCSERRKMVNFYIIINGFLFLFFIKNFIDDQFQKINCTFPFMGWQSQKWVESRLGRGGDVERLSPEKHVKVVFKCIGNVRERLK